MEDKDVKELEYITVDSLIDALENLKTEHKMSGDTHVFVHVHQGDRCYTSRPYSLVSIEIEDENREGVALIIDIADLSPMDKLIEMVIRSMDKREEAKNN